jgi:ADP-heptose:LPS heptosyltransferase
LVVRLRSIGDTVLSTASLSALRHFLPNAQIDILIEDWIAPLLEGHPHADNIVVLERGGFASRARLARQIRSTKYDVVYNLHGGTTATFLTRASGARHRVGYKRTNTRNCTIIRRRRRCCSGANRKHTQSNNNSRCSVGPEFQSRIVRLPISPSRPKQRTQSISGLRKQLWQIGRLR